MFLCSCSCHLPKNKLVGCSIDTLRSLRNIKAKNYVLNANSNINTNVEK